MAIPINMPQVGQDINTAKIIEWHVKEGDPVQEGDILATVESDKASFEVEAPADGFLIKILFAEGDEGEVFKPIAYIGEQNEDIKNEKGSEIKEITPAPQPVKDTEISTSPSDKNQKIRISPSAKRIAQAHQVDFIKITGSGPNGRIVKKDILKFVEKDISENTERDDSVIGEASKDGFIHFDKRRKVIASRLTQSKQQIPHFYLFKDIDVTAALRYKEKINRELSIKISFNDLLIKAAAEALKKFPNLNAHVSDDGLVLKSFINIGVAVSVEGGLLVPLIANAGQLSLGQIAQVSKKISNDAKRGIVNQAEGTFTVSNLGMFGISRFLAIINPPECAILSVGNIEKKVVPTDDGIKSADYVTLGLSCDHRAVDGVYAAGFLNCLADQLSSLN